MDKKKVKSQEDTYAPSVGAEMGVVSCPYCGSKNIIKDVDSGSIVCGECGAVIKERIVDLGPEWRAFTPEEKQRRARTGTPITLPLGELSLSTMIDESGKDASGKRLSLKQKVIYTRLRRWHMRTRISSSVDRNLLQAMNEMERIASKIALPKSIRDTALLIYKKTVEKGLVRGRSIESVVAAALYAACRRHKFPITLDEIAQYTSGGRREVARCYRLILREVGVSVPIADPLNYVPRITQALNLKGEVQKRAREIILKAKAKGITAGKDPAGLAAAAIYIACLELKEHRTQKEVAQAAQVTEVTVRNRYKELMKKLGIKLPTVV